MTQLGFIILRHVNNEETNKFWIHCYNCIREHYPENTIMIVDDNSNYDFITDEKLYKTHIINSEYPKRGELLPYFYYLHNKLFDVAVLIHDSVFINKYIDFSVDKYRILWDFEHHFDQIEDETKMIGMFNDVELKNFYENKKLWVGCFGGMCVITHEYLTFINNKYDISKLLECVTSRHNRCSFERVIACLLQINEKNETLIGSIHHYCPWGITFSQKDEYKYLPLTKTWNCR